MTMQLGGAVGSAVGGFATQSAKNAILEPWWGANRASSDRSTRIGELIADGSSIVGGGAVAGLAGWKLIKLGREVPGGLHMNFRGALTHGLSMPKLMLGALAGAGLIAAATGIKNLFGSDGKAPPTDPGKPPTDPPTDPGKPPTDPGKPPTDPGKPPTDPGKPPTDPPTDPGKPPTDPGKPPTDPVKPPTDPGVPPVVVPPAPGGDQHHTVQPGEYLSFIASCYDVSWQQLYWANRDAIGSSPDLVRPGMVLTVPPRDFVPGAFEYHPQFPGGHPTPGLTCPEESPRAQREDCPPA